MARAVPSAISWRPSCVGLGEDAGQVPGAVDRERVPLAVAQRERVGVAAEGDRALEVDVRPWASASRTHVVPSRWGLITSGQGTRQPARVRPPSRRGTNDQT